MKFPQHGSIIQKKGSTYGPCQNVPSHWEMLHTAKKIFFMTIKPQHAEGYKHFMSQL